jgi:hypothetical protein
MVVACSGVVSRDRIDAPNRTAAGWGDSSAWFEEVLPGAIMTRHFDQRAIERAAVILRVAGRYSGDELDAALKAARRAIEICLKETCAGANVGCALFEAIDAARFIARNRA